MIYAVWMADNRNEQSNKWGDKAHLRIIAPLPSGANIAKTKSGIGKPGGGPTQFRGDQRSGGGGGGAVFSLIIFCVRGDQRSGSGGDGAAARTKISRRRLL